MERRTDEELFCAFVERRDCEALAALFRRRAEELLRLAVFLAPRPSEADDLVQATFLSAIARAETYRRDFRVMSWLCGILTNHARMLRRAERRPHARPERTATDNEPLLAALHGELRQALDAAIVALPEPYRSVMTLHLHDGLSSLEISQRLDRPPATVRKQMERALDRLRVGLPMSLASAFVARIDLDAIAERAAEAARFVDAAPIAPIAPPDATPAATGSWLAVASAAAVALAAALALALAWPADPAAAAARSMTSEQAAAPGPATPTSARLAGAMDAPAAQRAAAPGLASLRVEALDFQGAPLRGLELMLVRHDGQPLAERFLRERPDGVAVDAAGMATWQGLAPGRYDLLMQGSLPLRTIEVAGYTRERIRVPSAVPLMVQVVDPDGRPVEGAEVHVSETSGRSDAGFVVGHSRWDGSFRGSSPLARGRVFARHGNFAQSSAARIEDGDVLRLQLAPARRSVTVMVRGEDGEPLPGCFVALAPRSQSTDFLAPQFGQTDAAGQVCFQDPGAVDSSVAIRRPGLAPTSLPLGPEQDRLLATLAAGGTVFGVVVDRDGAPAPFVEVTATPPDRRSNEPASNLLAQTTTTGPDGAFQFDDLPVGEVCLRLHGKHATRWPLVPAGHVRAAATCKSAVGERTKVVLQIAEGPAQEGFLVTPSGAPIADWQVVALPKANTAFHGLTRSRTATTDAAGRFLLQGLDPGEDYQFGAFLPEAGVADHAAFPRAVAPLVQGVPFRFVLDPSSVRTSRMRCQALAANGAPCGQATAELRRVDFPCPTTRSLGDDGSCTFDALPAGRYQVVILDPAHGSITKEFDVPADGSDLDLGVLTIAPPATLTVQVLGPDPAALAGLRVVARHETGDKFVAATTQDNGLARLPPLPPGATSVLVHGPGIAPISLSLALESGPRLLQCQASSAARVQASLAFEPAENPYLIAGPLQVEVRRRDGSLVLRDQLGATAAPGQFDFATGLPAGAYRITALSIWGAKAEVDTEIADLAATASLHAELRLR